MSENTARAPQKRSAVMRQRLLDATLDVIYEKGWSNASTPEICRHANISRGAQTHHFAAKKDLLLAAIKQVSKQYSAAIDRETDRLSAEQQSLTPYLEILWQACLDGRFLHSWMEVLAAARTDSDLKVPVAELDGAAIENMRSTAGEIANLSPVRELAGDLIELSVYLLRGMVIQRGVHPDEQSRSRLFTLWCSLVDTALDNALHEAANRA